LRGNGVKILCLLCQGSGIGEGTRTHFGELMHLCIRCQGHGSVLVDEPPGERPFVAIFSVSPRYVVHMQIPRRKGGFVEIGVAWSPRLPPEKGRGKLTPMERAAYERGRNAALAWVHDQLGGGDWSIFTAKERH
jgi:hypothetical protein